MNISRFRFIVGVVLIASAASLVACSGDDTTAATATGSPSAPATAASSTSVAASPTDVTYVHQVCSALRTFADSAPPAAASRTPGTIPDPAAAGAGVGALQQRFQDLLKALQAVTPPIDIAAYHTSILEALQNRANGTPPTGTTPGANRTRPVGGRANGSPVANATPGAGGAGPNGGRGNGMLRGLRFPDLPDALRTRLQPAFQADSDCRAIGFSLSSQGG